MADRRYAGILAVLLLLAGGLALAVLPGPGGARVFGVSLLWWYCVAVAPLLALLAAIVVLPMTPACMTASVSPVLVATLLARVFAGTPEAPLLILAAATAPLLGVLAGPPLGRRDRIAAAAGLASAGLLVWAGLLLAGDLAVALGRERWHGVGIAGAVGLVAGLRAADRLRAGLLAVGIVVLAAPVVVLTAQGFPPWQAWAVLASRPALLFAERGPAASEGTVLRVAATLDLDEPHRVTALSQAVYRVRERDGEAPAVREWQLNPGDALMLRPGDRLELAAGVRVRFEAGKRIPGASVSGVAWADPVDRDHAVVFDVAGVALTLAAGAAALATGRRARRSARASRLATAAALSVPPVLALLAVCWGVYAADGAPELGLGAPPVAALAGLPALLPGALPPLVALVAALAALAALFAAGVNALGERVLDLTGPGEAVSRVRLAWAATIVVAAGLALPSFDAWRALTWGWGLAASAVLAPALAGADARASRVAAVVGALVFAALAVGGRALVPWAPLLADYPVLVAVPAAWALAAALRRRWPVRRAALTSSRVAPARRG
jgi:hypothetical protein